MIQAAPLYTIEYFCWRQPCPSWRPVELDAGRPLTATDLDQARRLAVEVSRQRAHSPVRVLDQDGTTVYSAGH